MSEHQPKDLGGLIADAAEANDASEAENVIRSGHFIVFQQVDIESEEEVDEEPVDDEDGEQFSVVLAEVDEDMAVVCFSDPEAAKNFAAEIAADLPAGQELPPITMDGNTLLDGLPEDFGLLVNPSTDNESYFPPGCFGWDEECDEDEVEGPDEDEHDGEVKQL